MRVILTLSCPTIIDDKPTGMILGRLEKTVEVWKQLSASHFEDLIVITSGGNGGGRRKFPSSLIMKQYLIDKGIPVHHVIEDNVAINTIDNVINCNIILKQLINNGFLIESLYVITSDFHISRVKLLFDILPNGIIVEKTFIGTERYHSDGELTRYRINEMIAMAEINKNLRIERKDSTGDK